MIGGGYVAIKVIIIFVYIMISYLFTNLLSRIFFNRGGDWRDAGKGLGIKVSERKLKPGKLLL